MTIPMEYQRAGADFEEFLAEARDALDFPTRNPAYTTVQAVLLAFRRRLSPSQILAFAAVLPPMLRAIFVADWGANEHVDGFPSRADLALEIKHLRPNHNLSPDNALSVVAAAVRHHVDLKTFDLVLSKMPAGSLEFWEPK